MKEDYSYGIIPLKRYRQGWRVLVIQHGAGHWAFPKGHLDVNETPFDCAKRELFEETGLQVKTFLSEHLFTEHYFFTHQGEKISKKVGYFAALVQGKVSLQYEELKAAKWLPIDQVQKHLTFDNAKNIILELQQVLQKWLDI